MTNKPQYDKLSKKGGMNGELFINVFIESNCEISVYVFGCISGSYRGIIRRSMDYRNNVLSTPRTRIDFTDCDDIRKKQKSSQLSTYV